MHRIFITIYRFIRENRLSATVVAFLFLAVCIFFARKITFDEDITNILPKNEKSGLTANILSQLNFSDQIVVMIERKGGDDDFALSETADQFLEQIQPLQKYYNKIEGKVDERQISETFSFVSKNLPLFLKAEDYLKIEEKIRPDSIAAKTERNYIELVSPTSLVSRDFIKQDPLGITAIGFSKLNSLNAGNGFRLENNYVVSGDGKNLLLFIEPAFGGSETKNNEPFTERLNSIKDKLNKEFKGRTEIRYFGSPFIAVANAKQIKKDIQSSVLISSAILFLLLIFYFRSFFAPVIIFIPTVFGAAGGLLFIYLIKDSISAISLSVSAILIGITIDYAIHILTHSKHKKSAEEVLREITQPVMMSASTTAISFLCLLFVKSEALKDLGIFASVTVMLSAVFTLIIIPHLYSPSQPEAVSSNSIIDRIGAYPYEKNRWLTIFCAVIIAASFFGWRHVKFNQNISDLNYVPAEMQANEKRLQEISIRASKSIYVVTYGNSQDAALEKSQVLNSFLEQQKKDDKIQGFSSAASFVLPTAEQEKRIAQWNDFWNAGRTQQTLSQLKASGTGFGFNEEAFSGFRDQVSSVYEPIKTKKFASLEALQLDQYLQQSKGLFTVNTLVKLDESQRDTFVNSVNNLPDTMAIDRQQINENFLGMLKDDFGDLVNYSIIAVIVVFLLFFRNVDLTIIALIPILLSGIVTAGIMYFLGLELNIFSTIVCTIIFGAGVDFNIFLTQAMQKEITTGKAQLPLYRVSIILALLTTVLAIGALIFAKHPALYSVASVALVGLFAVTFISFAMYPQMFNFIKKRQEKGVSPITFRLLAHSAISFLYYGLGGIFFSLIGKFFVPKAGTSQITGIKKMMSGFLTSVLYTNPFVKKRVINPTGENFEKPAVIIANHTSFLDTLAVGMVTYKSVFLVNDWVYKSPVFGPLVRALGFYPVSQGVENSLEPLREKVEQGFSLMVFPEAQRSIDNKIRRFHKGAFYLADQLNLDIIPFYIHGNSEVLPKNDFIIYDGAITVEVGGRISPNDVSFGRNYSDRTKKINRFYRESFAEVRRKWEDADYFRKTIMLSFLFKENDVADDVKADFDRIKHGFHELNSFIPEDATILHIADDYGQKDVLLALQQAGRKVFSYIGDEEKRTVAKQNYLLKRRKIKYLDGITDAPSETDVLLITANSGLNSWENTLAETIIFYNPSSAAVLPDSYVRTVEAQDFTVYRIKE